MAEPIIMPKLAMAMQEGQVIEWLAGEGEWVEKGQPVMVVETEKVTHECESPAAGYLHQVLGCGVTVSVLETVALLAATDEELAQLQLEPTTDAKAAATAQALDVVAGASAGLESTLPPKGRIKISPIAKKLVQQHELDVTQIEGTGPGGRIIKSDVEKHLASREAEQATAASDPGVGSIDGKRVRASIPVKGMRKAIADHMVRSLTVSAQMSIMTEVDMAGLIRLRETLLEKVQEIGVRITYTDLFVMILARAVHHVPLVNSSLIGQEIKVWQDINVGIAVAIDLGPYESGLIVPVIRNADEKSLAEIAEAARDLTDRAKSGRLTPQDVTGGTITLSNTGQFATGWVVSTPILNQPQSVIVQPGGIFDRPVVRDGRVVIRPIMTLSITYDHRVIDGAPMARFVTKLKELIEEPAALRLS